MAFNANFEVLSEPLEPPAVFVNALNDDAKDSDEDRYPP